MAGLDELEQKFEANKLPILATAGAAVVAFALYQRKKGTTASASQGVTTAGGVSSGSQVAGANGAAAYDSSASDVYGLVQPQLESLGGQLSTLSDKLNSIPVSQAPTSPVTTGKPIATTLFAPTRSGNYVRYGDQTITEVESDGSQLALTSDQWVPINNAGNFTYTQSPDEHPGGVVSRTNWNLSAVGQQ